MDTKTILDDVKKAAHAIGQSAKKIASAQDGTSCCSCLRTKMETFVKEGTKALAVAQRKAKQASSDIRYDIRAIRERDPAATSDVEVALLYSGFHALLAHRAAHALHTKGHVLSARAISQGAKFMTGIEIHPAARIGRGLVIDHGTGVVIGETAEIGDNCTLYQGVTLGGTGKDVGKRHPTLGNGVLVGAGAKVLGPFKVGDGAKIAANAVVLKEVPANATAVGIPAKVVKCGDTKMTDPLDQIHIPDPISQELQRLEKSIECLRAQLGSQKQDTNEKKEDIQA